MWLKLWRDFKDYIRKRQTCKSGDGAKKGLDPKHVQLMEKMNGFETEVPDLFSKTMSSLKRNFNAANNKIKSIWQSSGDVSCTTSKKRKIPPVSNQYLEREDKKAQLFQMMVDCKQTIDDLSEQSKKMIESKTSAAQPPLRPEDQARVELKKSLSIIIDQYFVKLEPDQREKCFQEMLKVFE